MVSDLIKISSSLSETVISALANCRGLMVNNWIIGPGAGEKSQNILSYGFTTGGL